MLHMPLVQSPPMGRFVQLQRDVVGARPFGLQSQSPGAAQQLFIILQSPVLQYTIYQVMQQYMFGHVETIRPL